MKCSIVWIENLISSLFFLYVTLRKSSNLAHFEELQQNVTRKNEGLLCDVIFSVKNDPQWYLSRAHLCPISKLCPSFLNDFESYMF